VTIALVEFSEAEIEIRAVRDTVFGDEQNVPQEVNWDGNDEECLHALARGERSEVVATGRLAPDGKIGRLAVLRLYRGKGVGGQVLRKLLETARGRGLSQVYLHAQAQTVGFYEQEGFQLRGAPFSEGGITHRYMVLTFQDDGGEAG
jgi:predicted GNAT family N-acyltransferase